MKASYIRYWMEQLGEITPAFATNAINAFESAPVRHHCFRWRETGPPDDPQATDVWHCFRWRETGPPDDPQATDVWHCDSRGYRMALYPVTSLIKTLKEVLPGIRLVHHGNEYIEVDIVPEIKGRSYFYGKVAIYKGETQNASFEVNPPITDVIYDPEFVGLMIDSHKDARNIPPMLDWLEDNSFQSSSSSIKKLRGLGYNVKKPLYKK